MVMIEAYGFRLNEQDKLTCDRGTSELRRAVLTYIAGSSLYEMRKKAEELKLVEGHEDLSLDELDYRKYFLANPSSREIIDEETVGLELDGAYVINLDDSILEVHSGRFGPFYDLNPKGRYFHSVGQDVYDGMRLIHQIPLEKISHPVDYFLEAIENADSVGWLRQEQRILNERCTGLEKQLKALTKGRLDIGRFFAGIRPKNSFLK